MYARDVFKNISPLDHRYWIANEAEFEALSRFVSEEATVKFCALAEVALMKAHLRTRGLEAPGLFPALDALAEGISPEEVYAEEERTKHNIRALVNVMKRAAPEGTAHLVHLGATSVDILDTAFALRVRGAVRECVLPLLRRLETRICDIAEAEAETAQVGRTHGQHAVPITFGYAMAEYASRLGKSILEVDRLSLGLRGKLAGAVGSYNALAMIYPDPEAVERLYLSFLGLEPSEHSTQLVEPEYLLRLLLELTCAFGILANLADDLRNLQRSEIDEVRESFGAEQVGSSTMPQKRNPWNSEHVKSLWKAFFPRSLTFFMDQISEHQRDLTNSASERFVADYLAGFVAAANRMLSVLAGLKVNDERMRDNLRSGAGSVLAEPAYILLSEAGDADAHETVRRITLAAEREGIPFLEALGRDAAALAKVEDRLAALGCGTAAEFFREPEAYRGRSAEKARRIATKYRDLMKGGER
jgi:adenylosuccinate lyase